MVASARKANVGIVVRGHALTFGSLVAALVAGIWFGVSMGRTAATATPLVTSVLERDSLHALGMRAIVLDISHSDLIGEINRGPLKVTEDDITRVLYATFDEVDTSAKAREVHAGLVRFVRSYPERPTFGVSIEVERPTLVDSIGRIVKAQYAALPQCGLGEDLSALLSATSIKLFGGSGEEFFHERHPDCRPPATIASRVEEAIDLELGTMSAAGPDSVDTFPEDAGDAAFATLMARIDRALDRTHPVLPLLLLLVATGAAVWGHPGWAVATGRPLAMFGVGTVLYGIAAVVFLPDAIQRVFEGAGTPGEASEVWASLGRYALQRVALVSGLLCGILGIAILAASQLLLYGSSAKDHARWRFGRAKSKSEPATLAATLAQTGTFTVSRSLRENSIGPSVVPRRSGQGWHSLRRRWATARKGLRASATWPMWAAGRRHRS